ncbi:hypothetical protein QE152_g17028 [Popillia japonica]|uniref:Uncharacterized protein n=1 Tax=Popillia japonica TaxID=7064 RepID=A0AAW1L5M2_POPJA
MKRKSIINSKVEKVYMNNDTAERADKVFINDDLIREEREIQRRIRCMAKEEKGKEKTVKIGCFKLVVDGQTWKRNRRRRTLEKMGETNEGKLARSKGEVVKIFKLLEGKPREYGLTINEIKTKYMVMEDTIKEQLADLVNECGNRGYNIEKTEQIEYLGVTVTYKGDGEKELEKRLIKGKGLYLAKEHPQLLYFTWVVVEKSANIKSGFCKA